MSNLASLSVIEKQVLQRISVTGFIAAALMFAGLLLINGQLNWSLAAVFNAVLAVFENLLKVELYLSSLTFVWPALFLALLLSFLGSNAAYTLKVNKLLSNVNPEDEASIFLAFEESCKVCVKQSKVNGAIAVVLLGLAGFALANGAYKGLNGIEADMGYTSFCVVTGVLVLYVMCSAMSSWVVPRSAEINESLESEANQIVHRIAKGALPGSSSTKCSVDDLNSYSLSRFAVQHKEFTERLCSIAEKFD